MKSVSAGRWYRTQTLHSLLVIGQLSSLPLYKDTETVIHKKSAGVKSALIVEIIKSADT